MDITRTPWGEYEILAHGPGYLVKRLTVLPGKRTSLQRHLQRYESWTVVNGHGTVDYGKDEKGRLKFHLLDTSPIHCSYLIGVNQWHRIKNTGYEPLVIIEVWQGTLLDERDIERKEDDYGRV